jgi:hypothetical protein
MGASITVYRAALAAALFAFLSQSWEMFRETIILIGMTF